MYLFSSYLALPFVSSGSSDLFAATFTSTDAPVFPRDPFVSRFYRLGFEARFLWPASRAEAPSHHSPGAAKNTGLWVAHKHFANIAAVHWKLGSLRVFFHCKSPLPQSAYFPPQLRTPIFFRHFFYWPGEATPKNITLNNKDATRIIPKANHLFTAEGRRNPRMM